MFRGFERRDDGPGFLWVVLGGDDPGRVLWAPDVFELAENYGLRLLKGGRLIDTTLGETVPDGAEFESPPTSEELAALATPPLSELEKYVVPQAALRPNPASLIAVPGVEECGVINLAATDDGFPAGPITGNWTHGFALRVLRMTSGAEVPLHTRMESEVIFVHRGSLEVKWADGRIVMGAGDTLTIPMGLPRSLRNTASDRLVAYVVRGDDNPRSPTFVAQEAAE